MTAVFQRRRANKRLQNIITAEAQVIVAQPLLEVDILPPLPTNVSGTDERGGTTQWQTVVALSALVVVICSVDRAAMSVALGPMGTSTHYTTVLQILPHSTRCTVEGLQLRFALVPLNHIQDLAIREWLGCAR